MGLLLLLLSLLGLTFAAASPDEVEEPVITTGEAPLVALALHVEKGRVVELRDRPGGQVIQRVRATTEFGSPTVLSVEEIRDGSWFGVHTPELENGEVGWIEQGTDAVRVEELTRWIEVDLSRRELRVREAQGVIRRIRVGIGRAGSSTPVGRFAVTDKLRGPDHGDYYGCCILALSGRQPNLPPGWIGGDRLAIHGTPNDAAIGTEISAGCVYAAEADLRRLMRTTRLGTPVVIHP